MAVIEQFGDYVFPANSAQGKDEQFGYREALQDLPGADGAWDHLGDDNVKAAGEVTHRVWLHGDTPTDLDAAVDDLLAGVAEGRQKLYWRMENGTVRWAWAKCVSISRPTDRGTRLSLPVIITFRLADPYRYARYPAGPVLYGDDAGLYGTALIYGQGDTVEFAFSGASTNITVTNAGNADALAAVTISCSVGQSAENVRLNRKVGAVTVQWFRANRTIAASKALVVDCAAYSVEYDGADDYDNFEIGTDQVEWMHLEPGDNTMEVVCANGGDAGAISFSFYPTYH